MVHKKFVSLLLLKICLVFSRYIKIKSDESALMLMVRTPLIFTRAIYSLERVTSITIQNQIRPGLIFKKFDPSNPLRSLEILNTRFLELFIDPFPLCLKNVSLKYSLCSCFLENCIKYYYYDLILKLTHFYVIRCVAREYLRKML